jgi:hypothetical protein
MISIKRASYKILPQDPTPTPWTPVQIGYYNRVVPAPHCVFAVSPATAKIHIRNAVHLGHLPGSSLGLRPQAPFTALSFLPDPATNASFHTMNHIIQQDRAFGTLTINFWEDEGEGVSTFASPVGE